ncbi:acyl-CoA dehydrogenase family protein [Staphylococcus intermedius]|uniref:Acyl-CoA dehydrogenase n=1 Tax=Staphylococcus intermedius NCTC 11048 TaxID=1141106 RepID=A0A380G689_STAIN|nr:acyl-CoA dehydrogenase family protein [Staphylococcus intermedius]PCF63735.1 acyl-CoA dehydrogenase [Staphylococcus intermedius]PCF78450.1 acyl-CoA dehydrogenase [Staphylococcus intermedius]PCF79424.1 acyl-CoA dehydrogenase [Staphylococcus intermedius]PCF86840.1 acyl-CoA dehydrogenase [Staphylococcus intermedius]PCF89920.1 acyl-CoA dehydrogenase [Staphylococcus intermedius]
MKSMLIQSAIQREWVAKLEAQRETLTKYVQRNDQAHRFPHENMEWLINEGYTQLTLPESYGGRGATLEDMVVLQSVLGSIDGPTALSVGWHMALVGEVFERRIWDQAILDDFAKAVKNGALANRAVSEAETGSPTRGGRPQTYARFENNDYILNGVKTFTSMSPVLTHIIVAAYIPVKEQVGFFMVEKGTPGLEIANNWNMVGMRGTESHDVILNDVRVKQDKLIEIRGEGPAYQNGWLLHIPATYLGIAQAARDYAVDFALQYSPNSIEGPIADLPVVQQNIGQMETKLITARHLLWSTARAYQSVTPQDHIGAETAASKVVVMNEGLDVIDLAMRIVGAKSLEMDRPLQRYFRDMRAGLHNPPMQDMSYTKIAQQAMTERQSHI